MRLFFFFVLQAFLQGIAKICEGEGRKGQVRSLRYGVEGSAQVSLLPIHPPNPTLSGPIGQAGLARIQLLLGSSHQLDACSPSSDDPLQQIVDGRCSRTEATSGQATAACSPTVLQHGLQSW